jgi:hypothetical protein
VTTQVLQADVDHGIVVVIRRGAHGIELRPDRRQVRGAHAHIRQRSGDVPTSNASFRVLRHVQDMGVGRDEGVDDQGYIVSGADFGLIAAVYRPVLESCVSAMVSGVDGLVAVYVYGSVATGRASPPRSDIDLLVVTTGPDADDAVPRAARHLSERYQRLAREVGVAETTIRVLQADSVDALGLRCFIKHYCVLLHGTDIGRRFPRYKPSAAMAWAFNHDIATAIEETRLRLDTCGTPDDVRAICRVIARKVMFTAASLTSVITSSWTTDRRHAAAVIAERYPEWADQAAVALDWGSQPTDDPAAVLGLLDGFATWLADELRDQAGPS